MPASYLPLTPDSVVTPEIPTIKDLADFVWMHGAFSDDSPRNKQLCREAAMAAYSQLVVLHGWKWFRRTYVFSTSPATTINAAVYTAATKSFEVPLGSAPAWSRDGSIQVLENPCGEYEIMRVESGATDTIYLRPDQSPAEDATLNIRIIRRRYPLPIDLLGETSVFNRTVYRQLTPFLHAEENVRGAWSRETPSEPIGYQIRAGSSPMYKAIELTPPPAESQVIAVTYKAGGRPIRTFEKLTRGTAVNASSSITFDASLPSVALGCVVRIAADGDDDPPTSMLGASPWGLQRILVGINGTVGTLDHPVDEAITDRPVVLSDPLDLDPMILLPAAKVWAMYEYGQHVRSDDGAKTKWPEVNRALIAAMEANASATYSDTLALSGRLATIQAGYDQWAIP